MREVSSLRPRVAVVEGWSKARVRDLSQHMAKRIGASHISRTYSGDMAAVAVGRSRVGIDVELLGAIAEQRWTSPQAFATTILCPHERAGFEILPPRRRFSMSSLWASKESLAKALGDARAYEPSRLETPGLGALMSGWVCEYVEVRDTGGAHYALWLVFEDARNE